MTDNTTVELLTIKDISTITGLAVATIQNYVSQARAPYLPVTKKVVINGNRIQVRISRADFETWWQEYKAKKPFGAQLHKKRHTG